MKWLGNKYGACGTDYYQITFSEWIGLLFGKWVQVKSNAVTLFGRMPK